MAEKKTISNNIYEHFIIRNKLKKINSEKKLEFWNLDQKEKK